MSDSGSVFDPNTMTRADFEEHLPEFFAAGTGRISDDPKYTRFLAANPDCAALVRDLEYIADAARDLLRPVEEPSDAVWNSIQIILLLAASGSEPEVDLRHDLETDPE